jgi:phosphohistidine phosphatase
MLSLILFRHAKSDWNAEYASDPERPLAQRGIRAARFMGQFLAATGQVPALALTSHAVRAKDTLDLARRQGDWRCRVEVDPDIYGSDADRLLEILRQRQGAPQSILVTGHEPTCSDMAARLIGGPAQIRFPTATMARIDIPADDWPLIDFGAGEMRWLVPPKLLGNRGLRFA